MQRLEPLKFKPVYQDYIWGGSRILERFGRADVPFPCAESWEIADRPEAMSFVSEGAFAGASLNDLLTMYGEKLLGEGRRERRFPLLVKLIDAKENLSVQVHPSEESRERFGGEPKTEIWYLLEGGPLYAGFKHPLARKELLEAIRENRAQDLLQKIEARAGDAIFIPGGRIHAIGAGCMMLEVQQNSNSTYRVFDWGRQGKDGKPRALHIEEALHCLKFDDTANPIVRPICVEESDSLARWELLSSLFFTIEKIELREPWRIECDLRTFQIFFDVEKGESILLPADSEPLDLSSGVFIKITL